MAEERESRKEAIHQFRQSKVARFQELANKDRYLAAQIILDPLGTLSRFGLVEEADHEIHTEVTKGSLTDIAYFKEAVAARGLENVLSVSPAGIEPALRVVVTISITVTWDNVRVTVTITVVF